ncbi:MULTISPECIES: hypothetical protein [Pseudonocardia]|jgi:hypothetical protein|uniref:Hydroxyneurosporene synthase (CrtC) n=2 Tax=Pseudonocardia TaxID=1847 RepID=A0A1Y2MPF1_PSEAH|nr:MULTISPECIES: hypothetical protein [Pseudonocardia]OSY37115.1 hypothetical protein BG845_04998 [Pseudonocardia autotrophica]TDN72087.1 hypothetical protein C8E95_1129 [Pseudonocardia autotrophica]BBG02785.1 hypothetical protein Pdca_39940 [Pseudonocardia autotrophica]GEC25882.1 hypothetical protein PSA01_29110 [Pseudonocardia saturnea]
MITSWDDYPVHQTPMPVAHPESGDPAHYERYWFSAFDLDATTAIGFGLSLYPNLGVVDAAFSVSRGGVQTSVFASGALTDDRALAVGPLSVEVVEPLRTLRVVAESHAGLGGELVFRSRTDPLEEPRTLRTSGIRTTSDRTRLVQFGTVEGSLTVDGVTTTLTPDRWRSVRDRSWGIRATHGSAAAGPARRSSDSYFVWSVFHFDQECVHAVWHEDPEGNRIGTTGAVVPVHDAPGELARTSTLDCDIRYRAGTRWAETAALRLGPRGTVDRDIAVTPRVPFLMKGLGYSHPDHAFGAWHGGTVVDREDWVLADLDPTDRSVLHTQMLSELRTADGRSGVGLFEHAVVGRHTPSGMTAA